MLSTWAQFTTISAASSPTPAAGSGGAKGDLAVIAQMKRVFGQLANASQTLHGTIFPAGKGALATVEVRAGKHWRRSGVVRVGSGSRYSVRLAVAGVYRVVYRGLAGPSVDVRVVLGFGRLGRARSASVGSVGVGRLRRPGRVARLGRRMPGPLIAVDAPYVLYRSFFALPDTILGLDGRPVNALLGSVNLLLRAAADFGPRAIVMCFGAEAAPYRVELFPAYHADRPPVPEALAWQFSRAPELFSAFGWEVESSPDVEADDLLGSLAAVEADAGGRALIVTGDRDMYQCVSGCGLGPVPEIRDHRLYGGRPGRGRAPLRRRAGARPRLHRAARRSVRRAAGRARDRAEDRGDAFGAVRVAGRGDCRRFRRAARGWRRRLKDSASELRAFRDIATLRTVSVDRPPDRATDLDGGAVAARGLGLRRLAERLEDADSVADL